MALISQHGSHVCRSQDLLRVNKDVCRHVCSYAWAMKFGLRTISPMKSLKARTTARVKRAVKRAIIPGYGQKGVGLIKDPMRSLQGRIYRRTTFSVWDLFR